MFLLSSVAVCHEHTPLSHRVREGLASHTRAPLGGRGREGHCFDKAGLGDNLSVQTRNLEKVSIRLIVELAKCPSVTVRALEGNSVVLGTMWVEEPASAFVG